MPVRTFFTEVSLDREVRVDLIALLEINPFGRYVILTSGERVAIDSEERVSSVCRAIAQWVIVNEFDEKLWQAITATRKVRVDRIATIYRGPDNWSITLDVPALHEDTTRFSIDGKFKDSLIAGRNWWTDYTSTLPVG